MISMATHKKHTEPLSLPTVADISVQYGFVSKSENEKLREDIFRPDMEKLQLFVRMLRRNAVLNKAVITHSK